MFIRRENRTEECGAADLKSNEIVTIHDALSCDSCDEANPDTKVSPDTRSCGFTSLAANKVALIESKIGIAPTRKTVQKANF